MFVNDQGDIALSQMHVDESNTVSRSNGLVTAPDDGIGMEHHAATIISSARPLSVAKEYPRRHWTS